MLVSYDTLAGLAVGAAFGWSGWSVSGGTAGALYSIAINVLAIVFAVFFAALAIIVGAPDDDFVCFMEESSAFTELVWSYRWCLYTLFAVLVIGIALFARCTMLAERGEHQEPQWLLAVYLGLFAYALTATVAAAGDCIRFAEFRARFARQRRPPDDEGGAAE